MQNAQIYREVRARARPGRADRAAQPRRLPARARDRRRGRLASRPGCSISTTSSASTTPRATRPGTRCSSISPGSCPGRRVTRISSYRYGGDEFAALLPGADRPIAHDVADESDAPSASRPLPARPTRVRPCRSAPASPAILLTVGRRTNSSRSSRLRAVPGRRTGPARHSHQRPLSAGAGRDGARAARSDGPGRVVGG